MPTQHIQRAARKYAIHLGGAMTAYAVLLVTSIYWLRRCPPGPWKYIIAVLPVFPILYVPVAATRFLREMDEMQRRIHLEGLAFGFCLSAVATLGYGFLENAGLPRLSWTWVWPVMAVFWVAGMGIARRRYQ